MARKTVTFGILILSLLLAGVFAGRSDLGTARAAGGMEIFECGREYVDSAGKFTDMDANADGVQNYLFDFLETAPQVAATGAPSDKFRFHSLKEVGTAGEYEDDLIYNGGHISVNFTLTPNPYSVVQKPDKIPVYRGENYIDAKGGFVDIADSSPLLESFIFKYNGNVVALSDIGTPSDMRFTDLKDVCLPGNYKGVLEIKSGDRGALVPVEFSVDKKILKVRADIDGKENATFSEGEPYGTGITYEGFVEGDSEEDEDFGKAHILNKPKLPVKGLELLPGEAKSDKYDFEYYGAVITILPAPVAVKTVESGEKVLAELSGSYSPYYRLEFDDVGSDKTDSRYVSTHEKALKYYKSGDIWNKYSPSRVYRLNLYFNEHKLGAKELKPSVVKIAMPENLRGKKSYLVMQFGENGGHRLIDAVESDGNLTFETTELGEFLLLTPVEGVGANTVVTTVLVAVVVVLLLIMFFALFRKKY